jgi:hypothetical protein
MTRSRLGVLALVAGLATGAAGSALGPSAPLRAGQPDTTKTLDGLGYTAAFDAQLKKLGQITPQQFAHRYAPKGNYLEKLTWDPTTARFYDQFNQDPRQARPNLPPGVLNDDFRLNDAERAAFHNNGFVVSARLGTDSFAEMYYRIFSRDLPVFVSSDALLHAWHRTYDSLLMEVEQAALAPWLVALLDGMADHLPAAHKDYGRGVLAPSVADADYFLAVARSLLAGQPVPTHLGQDGRVARTLQACDAQALLEFDLFGRDRPTDFSQFKPRGHYERSEELRRYFRALMWCGRIDLRVAGYPGEASPREMCGTLTISTLKVSVSSVSNVTLPFTNDDPAVTLSASVSTREGAVNVGQVRFVVTDSSGSQVGQAVTSNVSNGQASAVFEVPADTPVGAYTITAAYSDPAGNLASSNGTGTLTVVPSSTTTTINNGFTRSVKPVLVTGFHDQPAPWTCSQTVPLP